MAGFVGKVKEDITNSLQHSIQTSVQQAADKSEKAVKETLDARETALKLDLAAKIDKLNETINNMKTKIAEIDKKSEAAAKDAYQAKAAIAAAPPGRTGGGSTASQEEVINTLRQIKEDKRVEQDRAVGTHALSHGWPLNMPPQERDQVLTAALFSQHNNERPYDSF